MYLFVLYLFIKRLSNASMLTRPYVDVNWRQCQQKKQVIELLHKITND